MRNFGFWQGISVFDSIKCKRLCPFPQPRHHQVNPQFDSVWSIHLKKQGRGAANGGEANNVPPVKLKVPGPRVLARMESGWDDAVEKASHDGMFVSVWMFRLSADPLEGYRTSGQECLSLQK